MQHIIVYKLTCGACGHPFFEGDEALAYCPHCGEEADVVGGEEEQVLAVLVNPLTGEVSLRGEQEGGEAHGAGD